ncbi:Pepsin II-4 (Pepsin A) [Durusdinium trenchii]|uniref:Pepsin II-4 (Pepsin A) n=1 Tax=Durusdinium trenchii TaxID=1381693 RepID=A0ABP0I9F1_9DINO
MVGKLLTTILVYIDPDPFRKCLVIPPWHRLPSSPPPAETAGLASRPGLRDSPRSREGHACVVSRLGSPKQRFTAVFDTGSGITWVPGADCKSDTCSEHHRFGVDGSKSFQEFAPGARADGTIHYGTGQVEYVDGRDTLTFCDSHSDPGCHGMKAKQLKVESQPFGMSTNQTDYPFRILPFDGILGLAPSASSGSVMHALKKSNALDRNLFGVYLSEDTHRSGSISFGGIENAHIAPKSPLTWHQIQNDQEWTLAMKDILVDGKPLHICDDRPDGVCPAVVDTGSSLITGPSGEVEKLLSKVRLKEDCSNLGKLPNVSLRIADRNGVLTDYPLTPEEYTLKSLDEVPQTGNSEYLKEFPVLGGSGDQVPEVKPRCDPEMGVMDVPGRKWVIGDTFLRRYYSIYDDDRGLVGFAKSIHPDEVRDRSRAVPIWCEAVRWVARPCATVSPISQTPISPIRCGFTGHFGPKKCLRFGRWR